MCIIEPTFSTNVISFCYVNKIQRQNSENSDEVRMRHNADADADCGNPGVLKSTKNAITLYVKV